MGRVVEIMLLLEAMDDLVVAEVMVVVDEGRKVCVIVLILVFEMVS